MRTSIIAIDPGSETSGLVHMAIDKRELYGLKLLHTDGKMPNDDVLKYIKDNADGTCWVPMETPRCSGMPMAGQTMHVLIFIGRICQMIETEFNDKTCGPSVDWTMVYRPDVKINMCGSMRAKDANVNQALRDRFGGDQSPVKCEICKGRKMVGRGKLRQNCEDCEGTGLDVVAGPIFGVKSHALAALGVLCWFHDNRLTRRCIINPGGRDRRDPGIVKVEFD